MQILNDVEMTQVNGSIHNELLLASLTIFTVGFFAYQLWDFLHSPTPTFIPNANSSDAYYDGAMLYLSNGRHCA